MNIPVGSIVSLAGYKFTVVSAFQSEDSYAFIIKGDDGGLHLLSHQHERWTCTYFAERATRFISQEGSTFFFDPTCMRVEDENS